MIKEIIERNREESDEIKKIYNVFCESAKEDEKAKRLFSKSVSRRKRLYRMQKSVELFIRY